MLQFIENLDINGVNFYFKVHGRRDKFKSFIGGIVTVILSILSLIYAVGSYIYGNR